MWQVIHSYTHTQALEEGELVPVDPATLQEAGIRFRAVLTRGLWNLMHADLDEGQSFQGRLWDLLMLFRAAAKKASDDLVIFRYENWRRGTSEAHKLYAHLGPDDHSQPVITFMLPEDW